MEKHNYITSDPNVMLGKPCIAGTRITVELIMDDLAQGCTVDDIQAMYPHLSREGILAAVLYAADVVRKDAQQAIARAS